MGNLDRVRVALTGFNGGPGVCTFYAADGLTLTPLLQAMFASIAPSLPTSVIAQVENGGDTISDVDGHLVGNWIGAFASPATGADSGTYPGPAGACLTWVTPTVLDGKRVRGRTFIVPMGGNSYQADGTLNATNLTTLSNAASTFVTAAAGNLKVWHRPRKARAAVGRVRAQTAHDGAQATVTSATVHDFVAVLRSRRAR